MDWAKAAHEGKVPPIGRACDHYNRYEEDFDIAQALGHNCHRLSVEWARIEPEEGKFDEKEIEHYRDVLRALRARRLEPFVTLWHFSLPLWFSEKGGFEQKNSPEIFARYCVYVVEKLGDLCQDFSTINEPGVFASKGWLIGDWPPFKHVSPILYFRVMKNLAYAHNVAYDEIKKVQPKVVVSLVKQVVAFESNLNPFNMLLAWLASYFMTHKFMNRTYKKCDQIGINYYFYKKFGFSYHVELSTRLEKTIGNDKLWDKAEKVLENVLKKKKMNLEKN